MIGIIETLSLSPQLPPEQQPQKTIDQQQTKEKQMRQGPNTGQDTAAISIIHLSILFIIYYSIMEKGDMVLKKQWLITSKAGKIQDHYQIQSTPLGTGTLGKVLKGRLKGQNSETQWRAIKVVPKKKVDDRSQLLNEIQILRKLDHPNIVKLYQTFKDEENIYMVMEMCSGGQLFYHIVVKEHFSQEQARVIFKQIMLTLNYCHSQKVVHGDLRPQNILFLNKQKDSHLKLINFGRSLRFHAERKKTSKDTLPGTSYYMAPEVAKGVYDEECDIWSAGVILYILLSGIPPFNGETDDEIMEAIGKMKYEFNTPELKSMSLFAKDLISSILVQASKRPTAETILKHKWVATEASNQPLKINLERMKAFSNFGKLKKVSAMMIATQVDERDIAELEKTFESIDTNHDGLLTFEQVRQAIDKQKNRQGMAQVGRILSQIDIDSNGTINYTEFIASCLSQALLQKQDNLRVVFKTLDIDQDGRITKEELSQVLSKPKYQMSEAAITGMIKECDKNGNGLIEYEELVQMMSQSPL